MHRNFLNCNFCPRLRSHCALIGTKKRRAYLHEKYWAKPVAGFGSLKAEIAIVGLAPGAHGANRTGRIFTGDRSGQWLYQALFDAGLSNQASSENRRDGLTLHETYVTCIAKCAPPKNIPTPQEIKNCSTHLQWELERLQNVLIWIALGRLAYITLWSHLSNNPKPVFQHGIEIPLDHKLDGRQQTLILSYHPSQQNTFTGRLTREMFDRIFQRAKVLLEPLRRSSRPHIGFTQ